MRTYAHEHGCDGHHTPRQRCNTRALPDLTPAGIADLTAPPEETGEPAREAEADAAGRHDGEQRELSAEAAIAVEVRKGEPGEPSAGARDAATALPSPPAVTAAGTGARRAVADGPPDIMDTGRLPIAPVAGVAVFAIACAVVAWRALFGRKR